MFGFLIPIPLIGGIGPRTVIVSLVLYALLPILRNTFVGIIGVDAAVVAFVNGPAWACAVLLLILPTLTLGRWVYST